MLRRATHYIARGWPSAVVHLMVPGTNEGRRAAATGNVPGSAGVVAADPLDFSAVRAAVMRQGRATKDELLAYLAPYRGAQADAADSTVLHDLLYNSLRQDNADMYKNCIGLLVIMHALKRPQPQTVDVEAFLTSRVNNTKGPHSMRLFGDREQWVGRAVTGLALKASSDKRNVVYSYSMRGSGKTQILKHLAGVSFNIHTRRGLCLAVDAAKFFSPAVGPSLGPSLPLSVNWTAMSQEDATEMLADYLIAHIVSHVQALTGVSPSPDHNLWRSAERTPKADERVQAAYKFWKDTMDVRFPASAFDSPAPQDSSNRLEGRPLVMIDTIEFLADRFPEKHTSKNTWYTVFEKLCYLIPSSHGIFGIGCSAHVEKDHITMTLANILQLPALEPIPAKEVVGAVKVWADVEASPHATREPDTDMCDVLHELTAGVPRLLRLCALLPQTPPPTFVFCSRDSLFTLHEQLLKECANYYDTTGQQDLRQLYFSFLASSTKFEFEGNSSVVPMPFGEPVLTIAEASKRSVGSIVPSRAGRFHFRVPPLVVHHQTDKDPAFREVLKTNKWPEPHMLQPGIASEAFKHLGANRNMDRGHLWEQTASYHIYARYLVLSWSRGTEWVGANELLCTTQLSDYEINLKGGVMRVQGLTYCQAVDRASENALLWCAGHHDAYIPGRRKLHRHMHQLTGVFAVQFRHGTPKSVADLESQLLQRKGAKEEIDFPLLAVQSGHKHYNHSQMINIDATRFCTARLLNILHPVKKQKQHGEVQQSGAESASAGPSSGHSS